jgi:hypothetical protein
MYDIYGKAVICDASWTPRHYTGFIGDSEISTDGGWSSFDKEILFRSYRYDPETALSTSVTLGATLLCQESAVG